MDKNEIKKVLYKEKPIARKVIPTGIGGSGFVSEIYETETSIGKIRFNIPLIDKPINLKLEEPAQLLIRWLEIK